MSKYILTFISIYYYLKVKLILKINLNYVDINYSSNYYTSKN